MADYCTLANVKEFTDIVFTDINKSTGDFDTFVGNLISRVTARINSYCRRDFDQHTADVSTYSVGRWNRHVIIISGPITTMTTVEVRSDKSSTWTTLSTNDFTYVNVGVSNPSAKTDTTLLMKTSFGEMNPGMMLRAQQHFGFYSIRAKRAKAFWYKGYENIRVTSTYGFSAVPEGIADICIRMVDIILNERARTMTMKVRHFDDPEMTGSRPSQSFPKDMLLAMDEWRSSKDTGVML